SSNCSSDNGKFFLHVAEAELTAEIVIRDRVFVAGSQDDGLAVVGQRAVGRQQIIHARFLGGWRKAGRPASNAWQAGTGRFRRRTAAVSRPDRRRIASPYYCRRAALSAFANSGVSSPSTAKPLAA